MVWIASAISVQSSISSRETSIGKLHSTSFFFIPQKLLKSRKMLKKTGPLQVEEKCYSFITFSIFPAPAIGNWRLCWPKEQHWFEEYQILTISLNVVNWILFQRKTVPRADCVYGKSARLWRFFYEAKAILVLASGRRPFLKVKKRRIKISPERRGAAAAAAAAKKERK